MNTLTQSYLFVAGALIWRQEELLLVEQQWPKAAGPIWSLPGGRVEPHETIIEAMCREVQEETGLVVEDPGRLLYGLEHLNLEKNRRTSTYTFEIAAWRGDIQIADPDRLILQARFMPRAEAIATLTRQQTWRIITEPLIAYLQGEAGPGSFWQYQRQPAGIDRLLARL